MPTSFQLAFDARGRALSCVKPGTDDEAMHYNHTLYLAEALVRARDLPHTPENVRKASVLVDGYYDDCKHPELSKRVLELERELLATPFLRVHRACPDNVLLTYGTFMLRYISSKDPYYEAIRDVMKTPRTL